MVAQHEWVLLVYRLPREPSTPRIALWRSLGRLRRELRRITQRDFFPPPERAEAHAAVEALASAVEEGVAS